MKNLLSLLFVAGMLLMGSCSKEKQLERWLIGTWDINKGTVVLPDKNTIGLNKPGSVEFKEDKTGVITFTFNQSKPTQQDFTWDNTGESVSVQALGQSTTGNNIVVKESSKTKQVWDYVLEDGTYVTLEMTKRAE